MVAGPVAGVSSVGEDSAAEAAGAAAAGAGAGVVDGPVGGKGAGAPPIRRFRAGTSVADGAGVCSGWAVGAAETGSGCSAPSASLAGVWAAGSSGTWASAAVAGDSDTAGASWSVAGASGCAPIGV